MRSKTPRRSILLALLMSFVLTEAEADDLIFKNGFASGTSCAWTVSDCSLDFILDRLNNATSASDNEAALLAAVEKSIGSVPPEVHEAIAAIASFNAEFPESKGAFLSISQAHDLATMSLDSPPTLQAALAALTSDVEQAYANPQAARNARTLLMFSSTPQILSPLPLTPETRLTVAGSITYSAWLTEHFPVAFAASTKISQAECLSKIRLNQIAAASQIVIRNVAVVIFKIASAILNSAEAIVNCTSGGATEALGIVLDATEGCVVSQFVSWVEVDADSDCVGNITGPPSAVSCIAGLAPCLGDIESVISNAIGVAQASENIVNGVCTAINQRQGLIAACNAGCPECSELEVETACGLSNLSACFDPLNAVPTVSCAALDTPECVDFGAPEILGIDGPTIIPGGGNISNRVHFKDENAGINWFSAVNVADSCGGCWSDNAWDPGVFLSTSGSFEFFWYCNCGSSTDFHATYHFRLHDIDGNVSPPFTKQVTCSCSSQSANSPTAKAGNMNGGGLTSAEEP